MHACTQAVAIVGGVGSGKSTVMAGILGEVPVFPANSAVDVEDSKDDGCDHNDPELSNESGRVFDLMETASRAFRVVRGGGIRRGMSINAADDVRVDRDNNDPFRYDWGGVRPGDERLQRQRRRQRRQGRGGGGQDRGSHGSGSEASAATKHTGGVRVCYAAQSPWVMSGTVRENILFGLPLDHDRYR